MSCEGDDAISCWGGKRQTYLGWWMDAITAVGFSGSCASAWSTFATFAADTESSPEVGSSSSRTSGRATSSSPMLTRRISPPLMPRFSPSPMRTLRRCAIPRRSRMSSTRACFSESGTPSGRRRRAAKSSASCTVSIGGRMSCCGTKPMRGRPLLPVPGYETVPNITPDLCFCARISISVVFPAPLGPRMAIISPGTTRPLTLSRTTF